MHCTSCVEIATFVKIPKCACDQCSIFISHFALIMGLHGLTRSSLPPVHDHKHSANSLCILIHFLNKCKPSITHNQIIATISLFWGLYTFLLHYYNVIKGKDLHPPWSPTSKRETVTVIWLCVIGDWVWTIEGSGLMETEIVVRWHQVVILWAIIKLCSCMQTFQSMDHQHNDSPWILFLTNFLVVFNS